MKISKKQLRRIIVENIFSDAYEYMFGNDIVTTSKSDPYEYKRQDESWVYRKKGEDDSAWKAVNRSGAKNLNKMFNTSTSAPTQDEEAEITSADTVYKTLVKRGVINEGDTLLLVDGLKQRFYLKKSSSSSKMSGLVSTGRKGLGNETDSGKTSTGLMKVLKVYGKGLESGTVLVARAPTDPPVVLGPRQRSPRSGHVAEVVTRAITLTGLEDDNTNVRSRNIYLHGTNREQFLGSPASGGCIRMKSKDIIKLADTELSPGDYVYVYTGPARIKTSLKASGLSMLDKGVSLVTEEQKEEIVNNDQSVESGSNSDEEAKEILDKYPPELGA